MAFLQGDIVEHDFSSSAFGHEPVKRRPALVVSSDFFNLSSSMTIICPITSIDNGYPLHIQLPDGLRISGWIAAEQEGAADLPARAAKVIDHLDPSSETMRAVLQCIHSFF